MSATLASKRGEASALDSKEIQSLLTHAAEIILGKETTLRLALTCMLARGHLLIEDIPGVGKTTLAHLLAKLLGLDFQRIQFTSDLLPADIIGVSVYNRDNHVFQFHQGPVFAQVILADEINRATPKTQSALLEAMEEKQVTLDGLTHPLPSPFFVIATQNPAHQVGTFPLPESQLDRFLMRVSLGYPDAEAERALLAGEDRRDMLARLNALINPPRLQQWMEAVDLVYASQALFAYIQALLHASRQDSRLQQGLSPRAGLALLKAGRAWALLDGRQQVLPEDIQAVFGSVVSHRLTPAISMAAEDSADLPTRLLESVAIP